MNLFRVYRVPWINASGALEFGSETAEAWLEKLGIWITVSAADLQPRGDPSAAWSLRL